MHRLVPWLNRELHYLLNENVGHISYVMSRIIELLPQHHINSPEFREAVQRYFGERTEHFLHELYCFASTPYDMAGYDRNVQYTTDTRISTMINEVISSSDSEHSVDSDIVMVSSSEPAEAPAGPSRVPPPVYPHGYIAQPPATVVPIETVSQSDTDDDSSEVMVVGYIKPPQDRTPEIVDLLGSDSDVIVQDAPDPPAHSVKLTLKRHRSSDSDAAAAPSPARRRRRRRSDDSTTSDTSRSTPERDPERGWAPLYLHSSPASQFSSSDEEPRARVRPRIRALAAAARDRRRAERRQQRRARADRERRAARKSHSGKGVKCTRPPADPADPAAPPLPGPSGTSAPTPPSGPPGAPADAEGAGPALSPAGPRRESPRERSRRRRDSRETRRLRSVVNVMYNSHRNTDESNSSANCSSTSASASATTAAATGGVAGSASAPASPSRGPPSPSHTPPPRRTADYSSDSEDDLPLNLTLQKLNPSST